jgi:ADP-ribosylglycohydrolase
MTPCLAPMQYKKKETYLSLLALSVGDAAGENQMKILPAEYYKAGNVATERGITKIDILYPWTDDTHVGIGVVRTLYRFNTINQLELAQELARNFHVDPQRGYGRGTRGLLTTYSYDSDNWLEHSKNWWGPGIGSKGNGSAMRDAVIGAHFGPDYGLVAQEARLSAEVTHYHVDAIAGSIAVAIAAANVTYGRPEEDFWLNIIKYTPSGELRDRIEWVASEGAFNETNWGIIGKVGNGKEVTAVDTVPFALWQAHQALEKGLSFASCINSFIEVGGDTDTVGAIFGGIVGNVIKPTAEEIARTERLPKDLVV